MPYSVRITRLHIDNKETILGYTLRNRIGCSVYLASKWHEHLLSVHFGCCLQAATCDQFRCLLPYIKCRYLASLSQQRKSNSKKFSSLKLLWIVNRYHKMLSVFDVVARSPLLQVMCWYQLSFGMSNIHSCSWNEFKLRCFIGWTVVRYRIWSHVFLVYLSIENKKRGPLSEVNRVQIVRYNHMYLGRFIWLAYWQLFDSQVRLFFMPGGAYKLMYIGSSSAPVMAGHPFDDM